jgi:hypothetical protein
MPIQKPTQATDYEHGGPFRWLDYGDKLLVQDDEATDLTTRDANSALANDRRPTPSACLMDRLKLPTAGLIAVHHSSQEQQTSRRHGDHGDAQRCAVAALSGGVIAEGE